MDHASSRCARLVVATLVASSAAAKGGSGGALAAAVGPGDLPPTAAEASGFQRTATSQEVSDYVDRCVAAGTNLTRIDVGRSTQGKALPLVLVAAPPVASLAEARAAGRPVVFINANIHAGEVEGKEAVQILLREFAQGGHAALLQDLIVAFLPDYNPDGNDALDRKNRPDQAGPLEGVGQRANGMGLDLNRDLVKAEAPETRALLAAVAELDPVLVMDLHTTDGSFHGYDLTYAGMLHPACDPELLRFTQAELLPGLQAAMKAAGRATYDYGDFRDQAHPESGWFSFECKPRYLTNYFGFQNRLTLLSEAYSHAPFAERVATTRTFVLTALEFVRAHREAIARLVEGAATRGRALVGGELPTRGEMAVTRTEEVLVGAVRPEKDAVTGLDHLVDTGESHPVRMPVHVSFDGREARPVAAAYVVPQPTPALLELLARHGLATERLAAPRAAHVRVFADATRNEAERPFQNHRLATLAGRWSERDQTFPAGSLVVPLDQPRARLAFVLFHPESDDGLATWGLLGLEPDAEAAAAPVPAPQRYAAFEVVKWGAAGR